MSSLVEAREHLLFQHGDSDGWITLAKRENKEWRQYHYRSDEVINVLSEWLGVDVYMLQNTLYKPERRIENIRQFRACYVDLDCYLLNYVPDWVVGGLELEHFGKTMPEPNLVLHSGRGIVLVWLIEPVPYAALPLWMAVQDYLAKQLKNVGADIKALDPVRVFRIAGSINSKNGAEVTVQYRHDYKYSLRQIQEDYLPEIKPKQGKGTSRQAKVHRLFNVYSLHTARLMDLVKLVELRHYDVIGSREVICFLYRYWSCFCVTDPDEALRQTLEFNQQFVNPLSPREVETATRSAEKAWKAKNDKEANEIAQAKGYPGAGYNITNKKLISWLDITAEEQQHMTTIINKSEKLRRDRPRDRESHQKARRSAGMVPRCEYLGQAEKRRQEAIRMRVEGMSIREIAEKLQVSPGAVHYMISKK